MTPILDDALKRLDIALGLLEGSVSRRLEAEKRRGDLETELQLMQDDRARLAGELDGALTRLQRYEAATDDVSQRVRIAIGTHPERASAGRRTRTRGGLSCHRYPYRSPARPTASRARDGEEEHLKGLAASLDAKIEEMRVTFGEIGDMRLHVMAAITMADEMHDLQKTARRPWRPNSTGSVPSPPRAMSAAR